MKEREFPEPKRTETYKPIYTSAGPVSLRSKRRLMKAFGFLKYLRVFKTVEFPVVRKKI